MTDKDKGLGKIFKNISEKRKRRKYRKDNQQMLYINRSRNWLLENEKYFPKKQS